MAFRIVPPLDKFLDLLLLGSHKDNYTTRQNSTNFKENNVYLRQQSFLVITILFTSAKNSLKGLTKTNRQDRGHSFTNGYSTKYFM